MLVSAEPIVQGQNYVGSISCTKSFVDYEGDFSDNVCKKKGYAFRNIKADWEKTLLMRFLATAKNAATLFLMGMFHRHLVSSENIKVHTLIITIHFSMYPF